MNKKYIIKSTREFSEIMSKKNRIQNDCFIIYTVSKKETQNRFGISTPKKLGNAVTRNKLRRQTKEILRKDQKHFQLSKDCIIIVKEASLKLKFEELKIKLTELLKNLDK